VDDPALVADGDVRIRNAAVFGEANWEFVDRWQLHGGLRYDREKNETEFNYIDPLSGERRSGAACGQGCRRDPVIGWHAALQTGTDYKP
jgi:outer membrane receptor protein involved in Fe transport